MSLTQESTGYRPHRYPWAYDFWEKQQNVHWLPKEVMLSDDIREYNRMTPDEQAAVRCLFPMFVQSDVRVHECYHKIFQRFFKPVEVQMMLSAFSNMETVHIAAYSHLIDSLGLPETTYSEFMEYAEMRDSDDFLKSFDPQDPQGVAESLAGVSAFGEGVKLFASFAVLLNYPRNNLLKGMGQIVSWSVRDESLHCDGIMRLYHTWLAEHPTINRVLLAKRIRNMAERVAVTEFAFADLIFDTGSVPNMTREDLKRYIKFMINYRLRGLGEPDLFDEPKNPFPWVDKMAAGIEHANFFERQGTEYSRGATAGEWGDVFAS